MCAVWGWTSAAASDPLSEPRPGSRSGTHNASNDRAQRFTTARAGASSHFGVGNCSWWDISTEAVPGTEQP